MHDGGLHYTERSAAAHAERGTRTHRTPPTPCTYSTARAGDFTPRSNVAKKWENSGTSARGRPGGKHHVVQTRLGTGGFSWQPLRSSRGAASPLLPGEGAAQLVQRTLHSSGSSLLLGLAGRIGCLFGADRHRVLWRCLDWCANHRVRRDNPVQLFEHAGTAARTIWTTPVLGECRKEHHAA